MGMGDELMALGEAEAIYRATFSRVLIVDRDDRPRWSPVWENHPAVARSADEPHRVRLVNCVGARPYIKAWAEDGGQPMAVFSNWRARDCASRLALTAAEAGLGAELRAKIGPYVVVEPHVKGASSVNKDWGFARFQKVVDLMPGVSFVQMGPELQSLSRVQRVKTPTFRDACGILTHADAYLGPEGGLHHAAAALSVPAAVIFGSFISPATTGYPQHANFYTPDEHAPCGRWAPCSACRQALERIRPEAVAHMLRGAIAGAGLDLRRSLHVPH